MLNEYLKQKCVVDFINNIENNDRYFQKKYNLKYHFYVSKELALFIFYDALLKYKIIIDNKELFETFIDQLDKLFKRVDNFSDVEVGIHGLIARFEGMNIGVRDLSDPTSQRKLIYDIYQKYVENGYYIHGFSNSYYDVISREGFVSEKYENYYDRFVKLNNIFKKYKISVPILKDFANKKVSFTDDFVAGCYYSLYGPMFFHDLFMNNTFFSKRLKISPFMTDDYNLLNSWLRRYLEFKSFSEKDKVFVLDLVKDQWDLIHKKEKKVGLLLVRKKRIKKDIDYKLNDFLNDYDDFYEIVDHILSSSQNNVSFDGKLNVGEFSLLELSYRKKNKSVEIVEEKSEEVPKKLSENGKISFLLLLGSTFISLGVMITIVMLLRR